MRNRGIRAALVSGAVSLGMSGCGWLLHTNDRTDERRQVQVEQQVQKAPSIVLSQAPALPGELGQRVLTWHPHAVQLAREMVDKYGMPHEIGPDRLVWHGNGPWKRTEVINTDTPHMFPVAHYDDLLQVIGYSVPPERTDDLLTFNGSLLIDRTRGELGARCGGEAINILSLNLANDIITGRRGTEEARTLAAEALRHGMHREYASSFLFPAMRISYGDPDRELAVTAQGPAGASVAGVTAQPAAGSAATTTVRTDTTSEPSTQLEATAR